MSTAEEAAAGRAGARFIVPFLRHHGFVGRKDDLAKIHSLLQRGPKAAVRPVSVAGMGGIFTTRRRDDLRGAFALVPVGARPRCGSRGRRPPSSRVEGRQSAW